MLAIDNLAKLRPFVRTVLGDDASPALGGTMYSDDQIDGSVRFVFYSGQGPAGVDLDNAEIFTPPLTAGGALGALVIRAALNKVGGESAISYTTRALSVRDHGARQYNLLRELRIRLHEIEGMTSDGSQRDFVKMVNDLSGGLLERNLTYAGLVSPETFVLWFG